MSSDQPAGQGPPATSGPATGGGKASGDQAAPVGRAPRDRPATAEFGPRGYLPPRAAQRARKIILREQLGVGWPIAALVAAALLAVTGALFVLTRTGPPRAPFQPVGPIAAVDPRGAEVLPTAPGGPDVLIVRAGGGVRAYQAPPDGVAYCPESRLLEAGRSVWALDGRLLAGPGESLRPLRAQVHDGDLYVDPTGLPAPPPAPAEVAPRCAAAAAPRG